MKLKRRNTMVRPARTNAKEEVTVESDAEVDTTASSPNRKRKMTVKELAPKKPRKTGENINRPPTVEELNKLQETETRFHSNMFRIQSEEMLNELFKLNNRNQSKITCWLQNLNDTLDGIAEDNESQTLLECLNSVTGIYKFPIEKRNKNFRESSFQFLRPTTKAKIIGSQQMATQIGPQLHVDVCIEIPSACFQSKDFLNQTYFFKVAVYMCRILASLKTSPTYHDNNFSFTLLHGDPLRPMLVIGAPELGKNVVIHLRCVAAPDTFKLVRFVPERNNVRPNVFESILGKRTDVEAQPATPNYNAAILSDLTLEQNERMLLEVIGNQKNCKQGLTMLKVWLHHRHLDAGYFGFTAFMMTALVAYLRQAGKLTGHMSSYQVVRAVWNYLATSCWHEPEKGITLCKNLNGRHTALGDFHKHFDVVFVDVTGYTNITAALSLDVYQRVCFESRKAIETLDDKTEDVNSFELLFMTQQSIATQYDHILRVSLTPALIENLASEIPLGEILNFCAHWHIILLRMITKILRPGLSERCRSITPLVLEKTVKWSTTKKVGPVLTENESDVLLGIILNPEQAYEVIDRGPEANAPSADEFRKFWGEKSELRRFQDGGIFEACLWCPPNAPFSRKRMVVRDIIFHLLQHQSPLDKALLAKNMKYVGGESDEVCAIDRQFLDKTKEGCLKKLEPNYFNSEQLKNGADSECLAINVIRSFNELAKEMRALNGLPLEIVSVNGTSAIFRYCDPIPALANGRVLYRNDVRLFRSNSVYEGVISLSASGKWPENLSAVHRLKVAFYMEIAKLMAKQKHIQTIATVNWVDILKDGYVFRIRIAHTKEVGLLKRAIESNGVVKYRDSESSLAVEKSLFMQPILTSALHSLHQENCAFGPAVCMAKRWIYAQLLDSYMWPDECTELLMASVFLNRTFSSVPNQPQTGFFQFLRKLASTDWTTEMVILNFQNTMTGPERSILEKRFKSDRDSLPPLTICTSFDQGKYSLWSKGAPITPVLTRICVLAKVFLADIEDNILRKEINIKSFFVTPIDGYDVLIHLNTRVCTLPYVTDYDGNNFGEFDLRLPFSGFDSVKSYLVELRSCYDQHALFFYNPLGGTKIAVLWKPKSARQDVTKYAVNRDSILKDFKLIGDGLVSRVEKLKE